MTQERVAEIDHLLAAKGWKYDPASHEVKNGGGATVDWADVLISTPGIEFDECDEYVRLKGTQAGPTLATSRSR
jgi:hypothetical protein